MVEQGSYQSIPVDLIRRSPHQPRRHFDPSALNELADSIAAQGLIQPISVRPVDGGYELIAGERRWRAAQQARLQNIQAVVHEVDDEKAAAWALIENLQREDLNPLERAEGIRRLRDAHGYTQQQVASELGLSRSGVANTLRLLELDPEVQDYIRSGKLHEGTGKALAACPSYQQQTLARNAIRFAWTARRVEGEIRKAERSRRGGVGQESPDDRETRRQAERLSEWIGSPCTIERRSNGGYELRVRAANLDILNGVLEKMGFDPDSD